MSSVHAFKFLAAGGLGRFSGWRWPQPDHGSAGEWVEADGPLALCRHGVHACRASDLSHWIDAELWRIELAGELMESATMVVATRGRLLSRVDAWNDSTKRAFVEHCIERARGFCADAPDEARIVLARSYLADAEALAERGELAAAAYVSAVCARCASTASEVDAYVTERSLQSAWLTERLA
ncbi:MAG TPA: hypothetical protein VI299_06600 [Polyangiales bacterium]